ncbi:MAG: family 20 glycosylhydrolase [Paracoccaceae bacterium]
MTLTFAARIVGAEIRCEIGSDTAIIAPIFCASLMTRSRVVSGGTLVRSVAGYIEVALPDLPANGSLVLVLAHEEARFTPKNRAWLPLGAYLRTKSGPVALPELENGVRFDTAPPRLVPDFVGLKLIPQPSRWLPASGMVQAAAFACEDENFEAVGVLARRVGLAPFTGPGVPVKLADDPSLADGAYVLTIAANGIAVAASGDTGLFYAAITLLNLRETYDGTLPCGTITDAPRFGWRGQHLDCARHFYQVDTILRLLDLMALLKLNRFHWHFSDDEAFRLEVDCAPDIWQKTAFRGEGQLVPAVFGGGIKSGGSYSRSDVAAVLARAKALNIEVLPEIEVPAHAFALNLAQAGMRDLGDNGGELSIQGYPQNALNPALPETWALLEPLSLEVAAMFPIGMLHLGCDELPPDAWAGSAAVQALKAKHDLHDRDDVQGWLMARLAGFLAAHGIRTAAWEEAAKGSNGGLGHDALLFSWTGQGPGIAAARAGYDVVMCPAQHVYFDMAHTDDLDDWGAAWAAWIALEDVVSWRPVPKDAEDVAHRIVGVEGCFWSEFTTRDAELEPMLAPRILGLANKAWEKNDSLDGPKLRALVQDYARMFDRIGWQRHRGA